MPKSLQSHKIFFYISDYEYFIDINDQEVNDSLTHIEKIFKNLKFD